MAPLAHRFWTGPEQVSPLIRTSAFDWRFALRNLALVWVFAAFGEETGYRGYLLPRAADLGNRTPAAWVAAALYVAVLFGFGHFCQGPAGAVDPSLAVAPR